MSDPLPIWPVAIITNGTTSLASWPRAIPGTEFTSFSFVLDPGSWVTTALSHPSGADFATVLGGLRGLYINADFKTDGNDYARLDDVMLTAAVPEQQISAMLLAGIVILGALGRRRRSV